MSEINGRMKTLAECRRNQAELTAMVDDAWTKFDEEHADLLAALGAARTLTKDAQLEVNTAALSINYDTGEKAICTGLSIRYNKVLDYKYSDAFDYAMEHANQLLDFDQKLFKKMWSAHKKDIKAALKAGADIDPFPIDVEEKDVPTVVISNDLSAYLGDPE